jgi:PAS domain S-box-containing protein
MTFPIYSYFAIPLILSGFITLSIAVYAWRRRRITGAYSFVFLMLAMSVYSIGYGFELMSGTLPGMLVCLSIQYLGIPFIPALILVMAIQLTGYTSWLTRGMLAAFFIIPVITLALFYTNQWHHFFYAVTAVNDGGPFPLLFTSKGPWYWVHIAYVNISLVCANVLYLSLWLKSSSLFRRQAATIMIGSLVPWTAFIVYITGNSPWDLDLNPFSFTFAGIILWWGLFRYRLIDISPVAHNTLFKSMLEGVLVIDLHGRVVEANPAAKKIFGPGVDFTGMRVEDALKDCPEALKQDAPASGQSLEYRQGARWLEVYLSALQGRRGQTLGRLVTFRDITDKKELELLVEKNIERLKEEINRVRSMQAAMMPDFSRVEGYDIGSMFLPMDELSGDFIDGYMIDDTTLQVVVCDVMGHGIASAYVGMEIRSLFRAFSTHLLPPSQLITRVNDKLVEDLRDIYYFATVVICQLNIKSGEVVYSSGGHMPSLLYISAGTRLDELGERSPMIGMQFPDKKYGDIRHVLGVDDCLMIYTDGVVEGLNSGLKQIYGIERLKSDLLYNAMYSSKDIMFSVISNLFAFMDYEKPQDDITIVCLKRVK